MEEFQCLFDKKEENVKAITEGILEILHQFGHYHIEIKKTSLHIVKEKAFLGIHLKKKWVDINIVSNRAISHHLITKVDQVSKNRYHNNLRLTGLSDIDASITVLLKIAYER